MNWETFKSLNSDLQQEYLFRFKDKPKLNCSGLIWVVMALVGVTVGLLMVGFVMVKDDAFISVRAQVVDIINNAQDILTVGITLIVIYVLVDLSNYLFYYFKRYWWKKKWRIKKVKGNFWRREYE